MWRTSGRRLTADAEAEKLRLSIFSVRRQVRVPARLTGSLSEVHMLGISFRVGKRAGRSVRGFGRVLIPFDQFDNLRRVYKAVTKSSGNLVELIQSKFYLDAELAKYVALPPQSQCLPLILCSQPLRTVCVPVVPPLRDVEERREQNAVQRHR